jgi:anaerobic ribonucleoside-triphosphate reductase activating protein
MNIQLASELQVDSVVDGNGLRTVCWMQGCKWNCKECQNPQTHDMNGGFEKDVDDIIEEYLKMEKEDKQDGITFSGGDPMEQPEVLDYLCKRLKFHHVNIWIFTGYIFEDLLKDKLRYPILFNVDVLVDGPFILAQKDLSLRFRGSRNQRLIDVPKSLRFGKAIEWENF